MAKGHGLLDSERRPIDSQGLTVQGRCSVTELAVSVGQLDKDREVLVPGNPVPIRVHLYRWVIRAG